MNEKIKNFIKSLNDTEKDALYRYLWQDYIRADITGFCDEHEIEYDDNLIDRVVELYVYEGEYDCNLSYWDNIDNLIQMARENI